MSKEEPFAPPGEEMLHLAICEAVHILNNIVRTPEVSRAHDKLREALVQYADMSPGELNVPWIPYVSDRADAVHGHYAIARYNPMMGCREVWNLRLDCWAAFSDEILTEEDAWALLKTLTFGKNKHSKNP